MEYQVPSESLIRSKNAYKELAAQFLDFSTQKEELENIFSNIDLIKEHKNKKIKLGKQKYINHLQKILNLIDQLTQIKSTLGVKFSSNLIQELTKSLAFDYNSFIYDLRYLHYYQISIEEGLKLNIFISRGARRDKIINTIYYLENEIYPEILDIEHEAANLYLAIV